MKMCDGIKRFDEIRKSTQVATKTRNDNYGMGKIRKKYFRTI